MEAESRPQGSRDIAPWSHCSSAVEPGLKPRFWPQVQAEAHSGSFLTGRLCRGEVQSAVHCTGCLPFWPFCLLPFVLPDVCPEPRLHAPSSLPCRASGPSPRVHLPTARVSGPPALEGVVRLPCVALLPPLAGLLSSDTGLRVL